MILQGARHTGPAPAKHLGMRSPSERSRLCLAFRLRQFLFEKVGGTHTFAWVGITGLDTKIRQNPNTGLTSACTGLCITQAEDLRTAKSALGSYWSPETKFRCCLLPHPPPFLSPFYCEHLWFNFRLPPTFFSFPTPLKPGRF